MTRFAELDAEIPPALAAELLKRLAYVSEGLRNPRLMPGGRRLAFDISPGFEPRANEIMDAILGIARSLAHDHRAWEGRTVAKHEASVPRLREDPHPLLIEQGELFPFGRGRFGLGPLLVALMNTLHAIVRCIPIATSAERYAFPSLIGADVLDRCQYFRNFPSGLTFVEHLREDHQAIREFARNARWMDSRLEFDHDSLALAECLLAPSVCFHWYAALGGTTINPKTINAVGKCYRYESSNLSGLERLWDFTMWELVFAGSQSYVTGQRMACVEQSARVLEELGLSFEITSATDPFFADSFAAQAAYQKGFELKFELLVPLAYSGGKLAVGSINYHQDFFGRSFGIETSGDGTAHTGCLGFGLERLMLAFLAQHGLDRAHWPESVLTRVKELLSAR